MKDINPLHENGQAHEWSVCVCRSSCSHLTTSSSPRSKNMPADVRMSDSSSTVLLIWSDLVEDTTWLRCRRGVALVMM